jgi:polysaccharide export outer membrane protein
MVWHGRVLLVCGVLLATCGCADRLPRLVSGAEAYRAFPAPATDGRLPAYLIGPFDRIAVSVYQEDDLSVRDVQVDSAGDVVLPLVGRVHVAGQTSAAVGAEVAQALGGRYLVNPQVSVIVQESVSQKVTVEGSVLEPGVYAIQGRTTLLDAVAMAKGTSRVAALNNAVIFREIDGKRFGALFDLRRINTGQAPDPQILGNDTVVIGHSNIKAAWRDVLTAAPLVSAARVY